MQISKINGFIQSPISKNVKKTVAAAMLATSVVAGAAAVTKPNMAKQNPVTIEAVDTGNYGKALVASSKADKKIDKEIERLETKLTKLKEQKNQIQEAETAKETTKETKKTLKDKINWKNLKIARNIIAGAAAVYASLAVIFSIMGRVTIKDLPLVPLMPVVVWLGVLADIVKKKC